MFSFLSLCEAGTIVGPIFSMKKLRLSKANRFAKLRFTQAQLIKWWSLDLNAVETAPSTCAFINYVGCSTV